MNEKLISYEFYIGEDEDGYFAEFNVKETDYIRLHELYLEKLLPVLKLEKSIDRKELRPISDLIKEITYDGKTFIPLQELFYMVDNTNYIDYSDVLEEGFTTKFQIDDGWNHVMTLSNNDIKLEFSYDKWSQAFMLLAIKDGGWDVLNVTPQYPLFKKLLEWEFDIELSNEDDVI